MRKDGVKPNRAIFRHKTYQSPTARKSRKSAGDCLMTARKSFLWEREGCCSMSGFTNLHGFLETCRFFSGATRVWPLNKLPMRKGLLLNVLHWFLETCWFFSAATRVWPLKKFPIRKMGVAGQCQVSPYCTIFRKLADFSLAQSEYDR